MTTPDAVRKIRLGCCMEQLEFAEKLGITRAAISGYERGIRIPRIPIMKKMIEMAANAGINVTVEEFLGMN